MQGRTILILGGTEGVSRAMERRFAQEGDVPFRADLPGEPAPRLAQALRARLGACAGPVDVLIMAPAPAGASDDHLEKALLDEVARHCWPMVETFRQIQAVFGVWPRQVLMLSPVVPPDEAAPVRSAHAVNEVLVPYLNHRFSPQDVIFNLLRMDLREDRCEAAAMLVFALTSGCMDAIRGQVLDLQGSVPGREHRG